MGRNDCNNFVGHMIWYIVLPSILSTLFCIEIHIRFIHYKWMNQIKRCTSIKILNRNKNFLLLLVLCEHESVGFGHISSKTSTSF